MARRNSYRGKYELTKEEFLSAKYYAQRYRKWLSEYNALKDSVGAIVADDMPHGTNVSSPTEKLAIRRAELKSRIQKIEDSAREADSILGHYILIAAIDPDGMTFDMLKAKHHIPCEKDMYYDRRRKFYWLLSQKI